MANDTKTTQRRARKPMILTPEKMEHLHKLAVKHGTVEQFYARFGLPGEERPPVEVKPTERRISWAAWLASPEGQDCAFPGRLPSSPARMEIELERRLKVAFDAGRKGT